MKENFVTVSTYRELFNKHPDKNDVIYEDNNGVFIKCGIWLNVEKQHILNGALYIKIHCTGMYN